MHQQIKTQPLRRSVKLGYSDPSPPQHGGAAPVREEEEEEECCWEKFAHRAAAGASDLL